MGVPLRFLLLSLIIHLGLSLVYEAAEKESYNHYRILNDPTQVKEEGISSKNLFGWLNLKHYIRFKLWTRNNPILAHEIRIGDVNSIRTSNFDSRRKTKVIIHGFADTATESSATFYLILMRDAYLSLGDFNVFIVDYSLFAIPLFYWTSAPNLAGERVAEFLKFLFANSKASPESFHIIGFSWGAHVAGMAGLAVGGKIGRITGLDPAGPTFLYQEEAYKLDKSDAKFVDVIHTNGGKSLFFGGHLGLNATIGHVDFWPNGGNRQIGCPLNKIYIYETLECSHGRAYRYYLESISSPLAFPACRCDSFDGYIKGKCPCEGNDVEFMGEHLSYNTKVGSYMLVTKAAFPFGHGPRMSVQMPSRSSKTNLAKISYKDQLITFSFNHSLSLQELNAEMTQMCLKVLKESKQMIAISSTKN